jgi:hypothetical protein
MERRAAGMKAAGTQRGGQRPEEAPWLDEGTVALAAALSARSGDAYAEFRVGLLSHAAGRLDQAAAAFSMSKRLSESEDDGHFHASMLGEAACLVEMGRCAEAREIVESVDPMAGMWMGRLLTAKALRSEIDSRLRM